MRVLGIDCGSQSTGFGIVESDGHSYRTLTYGALRLPPQDDFSQRLLRIHKEVESLILEYRPEVVAVEDQFYVTNFKSVMKLGQVKGVVILTSARAGIPVFEYSPLEIKNAVTGYGRAEKHQVQIMMKTILKLESLPKPHDAADALALAVCHIHTAGTRQKIKMAEDQQAQRRKA